jgi:tRNA threonylcarbamoyladenosine biosynthesis protein TsaE
MKKSWRADNLSDLEVIAKELLSTAKEYKVFCFKGDLGAGKTTFIKTICKQLGVVDDVTSPTFSIVNEYMTVQNEPVYHFDFYRLKKEEEALDLGYEQYFFSSYYCFVEWPEKIAGLLDFPKATIFMTVEPSSSRLILCSDE